MVSQGIGLVFNDTNIILWSSCKAIWDVLSFDSSSSPSMNTCSICCTLLSMTHWDCVTLYLVGSHWKGQSHWELDYSGWCSCFSTSLPQRATHSGNFNERCFSLLVSQTFPLLNLIISLSICPVVVLTTPINCPSWPFVNLSAMSMLWMSITFAPIFSCSLFIIDVVATESSFFSMWGLYFACVAWWCLASIVINFSFNLAKRLRLISADSLRLQTMNVFDVLMSLCFFLQQGGDLPAGMQALPVGKIIEAKVLRKDNPEIVQTWIMCEWI